MSTLLASIAEIPQRVRMVVLSVATLAVLCGSVAARHTPHIEAHPGWALAIALAVFVAESTPIHILYRREATSFSLFEVPLVIGIIVLPGWQLQIAVMVGLVAALRLVRKQPLVKLLFNVPNLLLHASATILLFDLFASDSGFGPSVVFAAVFASLVGSVLASTMIALVIRVSEGALDFGKTCDMLGFSVLVGVTNSSLAMTAFKLGSTELWSVGLLVVPLLVATGAYRAFVSERHQREQLQFLLSATKTLHTDLDRSESIEVLSTETAAMFRASQVELVIFDNADAVEAPVQCSVNDKVTSRELNADTVSELRDIANLLRSPARVNALGVDGRLGEWLRSLGVTEALVAPLRSDSDDIGLFVVADRVGAVSSFGLADLELFSTLAFQVGTALENDRLGQALTQLKKLEAELSHLAVHDTLTGLANRLGLRTHLETAVSKGSVDLLFLDLDDFKLVNDTLGHATGDRLLVEVAVRISHCLRVDDFAARLGGDEFAICVAAGHGQEQAQRIVDAIGRPATFEQATLNIGCSIGIAASVDTQDVSGTLRQADIAMYAAKTDGKNRVRIYTEGLGDELVRRQRLLHQLQTGIGAEELRVHYQPIFSLEDSHRPIGAEALVRWASDSGLLSAVAFLDVAEESGLVREIDRWVYSQVMSDISELEHLDWVAVNLSARHLQEDDVVDWLITSTRAAGVSPARVVLEVTETATMADIESSIEKLTALRSEGFGLALDDFGTGHSSIAYLRRLPMSMLKIAQPFVADLDSTGDPTFVKAIIDLAHTLGLPVVGEGVETPEQLAGLQSMGCDLAQGFLFSKPVAIEDLPLSHQPRTVAAS